MNFKSNLLTHHQADLVVALNRHNNEIDIIKNRYGENKKINLIKLLRVINMIHHSPFNKLLTEFINKLEKIQIFE